MPSRDFVFIASILLSSVKIWKLEDVHCVSVPHAFRINQTAGGKSAIGTQISVCFGDKVIVLIVIPEFLGECTRHPVVQRRVRGWLGALDLHAQFAALSALSDAIFIEDATNFPFVNA